ncbi:MAG: hypothetical protein HYS86_03095 [Candidatus Chisholmbacteria bacterium]|nr:hypothetical protein [Candidatus Chisholmbacteria bacterium]
MTRLYGESIANLGLAAIEVAGIYFLLREGRRLRGGVPIGEAAPAEPPPTAPETEPGVDGTGPILPLQAEFPPEPADTGAPQTEAAPVGGEAAAADATGTPDSPDTIKNIFAGLSEQGKKLWRYIDDDLLGETDERIVAAVIAAVKRLTLGFLDNKNRAKGPASFIFDLAEILAVQRKHPQPQKDEFDVAAEILKQSYEGLSPDQKRDFIKNVVLTAETVNQHGRGRQQRP